jgi:hypothetical protein
MIQICVFHRCSTWNILSDAKVDVGYGLRELEICSTVERSLVDNLFQRNEVFHVEHFLTSLCER